MNTTQNPLEGKLHVRDWGNDRFKQQEASHLVSAELRSQTTAQEKIGRS